MPSISVHSVQLFGVPKNNANHFREGLYKWPIFIIHQLLYLVWSERIKCFIMYQVGVISERIKCFIVYQVGVYMKELSVSLCSSVEKWSRKPDKLFVFTR